MRITNRAHVPWAIFVVLASAAAGLLYLANFHPQRLPFAFPLPRFFGETPPSHRTVGGTPLGLIFGSVSFAIFIFAALLGARKRVVLWRIGRVQVWLRAHIWLTLLTVPLILLHAGFRLGGPMTTLLLALYAFVMVSGIYGLILQHHLPAIMKERLPAETVYEQIPHIRRQLLAAAEKMRDSFQPPAPPATAAKAAAASPAAPVVAKPAPAESPVMAAKSPTVTTPAARAKSTTGSPIIAAPVTETAAVARETPAGAPAPKPDAQPAPSAPAGGVAGHAPAPAAGAVVPAAAGPKPKSEFEVSTGAVGSTRTEPGAAPAGAVTTTDATGSPRTAAAPERSPATAANASSAQTNASSAQTNPSSAQANPSSAQTNPSSAQANPSSAQANPSSAQTNPSSAQTNPSSAQTNLSSAQTNLSSAQTNPPAAQTNPPAAQTNPPAAQANPPAAPANPPVAQTNPPAAPANPPAAQTNPTAAQTNPQPAKPAAKPAAAPKPAATTAPKPAAKPAPAAADPESEAVLAEFLTLEVLPYLNARSGRRLRLQQPRYSEDTFRLVKLRVAEAYRARVEEIQSWCDERRALDLQVSLQHWLHGWLFVHVPLSFLLLLLTAWHAIVTVFLY